MVIHIRRHHYAWVLCAVILAACVTASSLPVSVSRTDSTTSFVVTVDAGHGGFDGGATAADGTQEKEVNLQVALTLAQVLRLCGVQVTMTRTADEALCEEEGLRIREKKVADMKTRLAMFEQADANISIHQNSYSGATSCGTQVFYSANHPSSERLASAIRTRVIDDLQPDNHRPLKSGNRDIYLLYHTTVPTVLVECGFLSHPAECERLTSATYQQQLAWSIGMGVMQYISGEQGGTDG